MQLYARDVGQGTPLVLLHAFPLSSSMWLPQREALAGRFRIITPDLRGFGGSVLGAEEPSVETMADDVAALLKSKNIPRAVIGGLSMGGYVAMALCRRHPDRVRGLVLADTKATADADAARENRLRTADRIIAENSVAVLTEELLPKLIGPTTMRQRALVYGRIRGLVQSTPPKAAAWAQRAMAARPDSTETLRAVRAPALVIVGAEDGITTEADARHMADALPNGELHVIPRSGHLTSIEQPDLFNQSVADFVSAVAKSTA
ncbi:pimeloyl-ACP methyl ester carboxylesterase [Actinocorallia herbida]|uniref:Pimeloyl-ACP methyl ester carboxylesterase n=1 Tax=Actinocorallia herbida TaxID=58109 RepID=A0A3N1D8P7_9ACTN|nr:alpha/beta hydrolase [Actinocorallia herbida]ROO89839.1 pimeloyl-ACP methyl ester carboxylesterase [Actinocorallia herbida]